MTTFLLRPRVLAPVVERERAGVRDGPADNMATEAYWWKRGAGEGTDQ
jgi:hypothetical protein